MEYNDSEIYRFQNLVSENGMYYGMMNENFQLIKKPIEVYRIKSVRVYDKSKSLIITIGVPVVMAGLVDFLAKESVT